jgi:hypothetical protein
MRLMLALLVAGCGFHAESAHDLAGVDLAGADLSGTPTETGPGPLGALSNGYCCSSARECRYRTCTPGGTCLDHCDQEHPCLGSGYTCNINLGLCSQTNGATCLDPSGYRRGRLASGSCCQLDPDCEGGICVRIGLGNPFFCTQGCEQNEPCPVGYTCDTLLNGGSENLQVCIHSQSIGALNAQYSCP